jgi:hypothetical protein
MLPAVLCARDGPHAVVRFVGDAIGRARLPRDGAIPSDGESVMVALRPERVRFLDAAEASEAAPSGIVASHAFLGRSARYVVQLPNQHVVVSTTTWPPPASLHNGAKVRLGWAGEDAQILSVQSAGAESIDKSRRDGNR